MNTIDRIIINFDYKCNMSCPYCYVPFTNEAFSRSALEKIIARSKELDVKVITFGGGDPFIYSWFPSAVESTRELGIEIHVDTNGIGLRKEHYFLFRSTVSLIGLPLDGPDAETHNRMRNSTGHFEVILNHLNNLSEYDVTLKVNTVASCLNYEKIRNMSKLVTKYGVDIWSVYQFMPIERGSNFINRYFLSDKKFSLLVDSISESDLDCEFEPGSASSRRDSYLFVSPNGEAYTHDPEKPYQYLKIGKFECDETLRKYFEINSRTLRASARYRYSTI